MDARDNPRQPNATALADEDFISENREPEKTTNKSLFSSQVLSISKSHRLGDRSFQQRVVYALLVHTLNQYRAEKFLVVLGIAAIPFSVAAGTASGFAAGAAVGATFSLIGYEEIPVVVAAILIMLAGRSFLSLARDRTISLDREDDLIDGFKLGRMDDIFTWTGPATAGFFLGVVIGIQQALLMFTPSHLGLAIEGSFRESFLLTLDNACHGFFLDTFELYDIHWGHKLEHGTYSATVFLSIRLAIDGLAVLMGYMIWQRHRLKDLFRYFPHDDRDIEGVLKWIADTCGEKDRWPNRFHDEMLFMLVAKSYIESNFAYVRQLTRDFRSIQVEQEVRDIFQTPDKEVVFHPETESAVKRILSTV